MRIVIAVIVSFITLVSPHLASAHAQLDRASPAVGGAVAVAPKEVVIWFTEAVEPKFSSIEVRDAKGTVFQNGPAAGVSGNTAQLRVPLKPLPPGTYTVKWRVLSVDTHRSQGNFTFRVGP